MLLKGSVVDLMPGHDALQATDGTACVTIQIWGEAAESPVVARAIVNKTRLEVTNLYVDPQSKLFKSSDVGYSHNSL